MPAQETYLRAPDGFQRYVRCWQPDGPARGAVVIVHGFCEHGGRYAALAEIFCRQGLAVFAPDLLGHGHSEGPRAYVNRFDDFLDDLDRLLVQIRAWLPAAPIFLLGHSMGGTIAARLAINRRPPLAGLILSAAAVRVHARIHPLLRKLAGVASRLFPRLRLVRIGAKYLSRNPAVVADFRADPLVFHGRFTVRIGAEILRAAQQLDLQAAQLRLPLLILHGTDDFVADVAGSRHVYDACGSADKTFRLCQNAYHDLFHDPGWEELAAETAAWITARIENKSGM
jgi:alpha-beta hydrolase superfamily lysophospholipase